MKKYILIVKQEGGCDYTIECGTKKYEFDAFSADVAYEVVEGIISEHHNQFETKIQSAELFEIKDFYDINISKLYQNIESFKTAEQRNKELDYKFEMYKKLKKELFKH